MTVQALRLQPGERCCDRQFIAHCNLCFDDRVEDGVGPYVRQFGSGSTVVVGDEDVPLILV